MEGGKVAAESRPTVAAHRRGPPSRPTVAAHRRGALRRNCCNNFLSLKLFLLVRTRTENQINLSVTFIPDHLSLFTESVERWAEVVSE